MTRAFRFGVNMASATDRAEWIAKCRRSEELGYDVLLVPDHLGMAAPVPSLMLAAEVTSRMRLGTFVLNAGFWNPVLLSRDVAALAEYTSGRFELGLGAGYVRAEFEEAGLGWPSAGSRVDHLARVVGAAPDVPLLIGGNGDRVLRLAATSADVVAFAGLKAVPGDPPLAFLSAAELDSRVAYVRDLAGDREYESNLLIQAVLVTSDRSATAEQVRAQYNMDLSVTEMLELPALLVGEAKEIAAQLVEQRDRYGISYVVVLEPFMEAFAGVIELLK
jgi:alkanesulfonate monooxygenase SsuD/methylene tetrahydromethanopterin reductase-like flavin-dependent oxidoreductase (luciferase family)